MTLPDDARAILDDLAAEPARAALLLDFDGTLAPIVSRPEDARLMDGAREAIEGLRDRLGLVAFISGRGLADLEARVGIPGLAYAGNHGMETQHVGGAATLASDAAAWRPALHEFMAAQAADPAGVEGVEVEDKGATLSVHWRNAPDLSTAEAWLRGPRTADAEGRGLVVTWGRMVMEVRPPVTLHKGTAARELVEASGCDAAVHLGDDRTDADAWATLHAMRADGTLRVGAGLAAVFPDAPPELVAAADARLDGPPGALAALHHLVAALEARD